MMRNVRLALLFLCLCSGALAETYVVTKDGKGFWSLSVRKDEKAVYYIDRTTGEEKPLALSAVDGIVPSVQKGFHYEPAQIKSRLEEIKALLAKHVSLTRELNQLRQEWEDLQRGDPGFAKQIDAIVARFDASDKGILAYKSATMDLGMIKFKDVQGAHTARIDGLVGKVRDAFVAAGFARLDAMASTNRMSVDDFLETKTLASALSDAGQKEKAARLLEAIRRLAFILTTKETLDGFAASKTVEAYLASSDMLIRIKREIATGEGLRKIEAMMEGLVRDVGKAQPAFSFGFKGYPMTRSDSTILSGMQRFSSRSTSVSSELDEQCLVFPLQRPATIRMNKPFSVSLRLIFNRAQPKDRVFGVMVVIPGVQGTTSHAVVLDDLQIKNGHADITFTDAFDHAAKGFVPAPDQAGEYGAYLSVVCRIGAEGNGAQWRPISCTCRFPME